MKKTLKKAISCFPYNRFIPVLLTILFIPFFLSISFAETVDEKDLSGIIPKTDVFIPQDNPFNHYLAYNRDSGRFMGVAYLTTDVVPDETWGYRDQIVTLVGIDEQGKITGVKILEENETPRYTRGLLNDGSWFLDQFIGKDISDNFLMGDDVDAITGATISSSSITGAIESSVRVVSQYVLELKTPQETPVKHLILHHILWQIDFIFLWIILAIAIVSFLKKSRPLRYLVLGLSIVYIGFIKGGGFSMLDILNIGYLNLPVFLNNFYWYSLVLIAIGLTILAGRFYCGWLCPFGAVLELLSQLNTKNINLSPKEHYYLKYLKYFLLAVIMLTAFVFFNKQGAILAIGILEPFAAFFRMYGTFFTWVWIVIILILSAYIKRFYCRYLCPLGAFFAIVAWICSFLRIRQLYVHLPQKDCSGCGLAQKECQMHAISLPDYSLGPEISPEECFMCNTCAKKCPVETKKEEKQ